MYQQTLYQALSGVLATQNNKWLSSVIANALPNPNKIIQMNSGTVSVLADLLDDGHVSSCVQSRKAGVLKMKWKITIQENGSAEQLTEIQSFFNNLNMTKITEDILNAPLFGFQPLEIIWHYIDNKLVPVDISGKPQDWFEFDNLGRLRFKNLDSFKHELVPKMKFFDVRYKPTYLNPYGDPLLAKCFYPVMFKKEAVRLLARFIEKYGMPYLVGKVQGYDNTEEREEMADQLFELAQDGVIIIPEDRDVSLLDNSSKASADIYNMFISLHNADISKVILSQTLTTEQSSTGSYAMSQTHMEVLQNVIDADAALVEECFNNLIKWYCEINYNLAFEPPKFELYEETQINKEVFDVAIALLNTNKIEFTKDFYTRRGFQEDEFNLVSAPNPTFAENDNAPVDTVENTNSLDVANSSVKGVEKLNNALSNDIIDNITSIIENAPDLETAYKNVINAYNDLEVTEIEKVLANAITIGKIGGYMNGRV